MYKKSIDSMTATVAPARAVRSAGPIPRVHARCHERAAAASCGSCFSAGARSGCWAAPAAHE